MTAEFTWLGHGSWSMKLGEQRVLLDPFLNDSPTAPVKADDVEADCILVSHGHFDHVADVAAIAKRTGAQVIANFEVAQWFAEKHGVENTVGMNLGGGCDTAFGRVKMTLAHHSSQLPDGSYGGNPGGFLIETAAGQAGGEKLRVYFACDTALFSDMLMIGRGGLDLAVLPIGDLFTMGPDDALEAVKLLQPRAVAPAHYNTWPPIEQDAEAWAKRVEQASQAKTFVPQPGESFSL